MAEKRNIFLVGPMGAGKSTIERQLAQQLNMEFYVILIKRLRNALAQMWAGSSMSKAKTASATVKKRSSMS